MQLEYLISNFEKNPTENKDKLVLIRGLCFLNKLDLAQVIAEKLSEPEKLNSNDKIFLRDVLKKDYMNQSDLDFK